MTISTLDTGNDNDTDNDTDNNNNTGAGWAKGKEKRLTRKYKDYKFPKGINDDPLAYLSEDMGLMLAHADKKAQVSLSISLCLSISITLNISILVVSCFLWSAALDS